MKLKIKKAQIGNVKKIGVKKVTQTCTQSQNRSLIGMRGTVSVYEDR